MGRVGRVGRLNDGNLIVEIRFCFWVRTKELPINPDEPVNRIESALIWFFPWSRYQLSPHKFMFMENKSVLFLATS
jgi:hypothetical protein